MTPTTTLAPHSYQVTENSLARMANDLPLIKRAIQRHALTLHAAVLAQCHSSQDLAHVAKLGSRAAIAVREFSLTMEAISRKQYPQALWLNGYEELDEDQDPFEWLPNITKERKSQTSGSGAITE